MSEYVYIAREVRQKLDEALRKKAAQFSVKEAVYFDVAFNCKAPAKVDLWAIQPVSDNFDNSKELCSAITNYLNAEIGPIASQIRETGLASRQSNVCDGKYVIAIYGQQIGSDIFLTGICSTSATDAKTLEKILAVQDVYSPTSDYLNLCERYGCLKEPPPD